VVKKSVKNATLKLSIMGVTIVLVAVVCEKEFWKLNNKNRNGKSWT
jgi:hypothetical protein